jgi:hypothetical protein
MKDVNTQGTTTGRFSATVSQESNTPKAAKPLPDVRMSKYRAESYLRRLGAHEVISDLYDDDDFLSSALISTIPGFEYPDWSYKTIGDVLKKYFPT